MPELLQRAGYLDAVQRTDQPEEVAVLFPVGMVVDFATVVPPDLEARST
jgi:hypothetical protein